MTCHLFGDSVYSWSPATVNYVFTVLVYRLFGLYFILLKKWKHCPRYWPFVKSLQSPVKSLKSPVPVKSSEVSEVKSLKSPVKSLHKGPATRKLFPFDDVIMQLAVSMCTVFPAICTHGLVVFCFGVVIGFNQLPLFSKLLHWHCQNLMTVQWERSTTKTLI